MHFVFWQTAWKSPKTAVNLHRTALPGDVERRAEVRLYPVLENTPSVSAFWGVPVLIFARIKGGWSRFASPQNEDLWGLARNGCRFQRLVLGCCWGFEQSPQSASEIKTSFWGFDFIPPYNSYARPTTQGACLLEWSLALVRASASGSLLQRRARMRWNGICRAGLSDPWPTWT